MSEDCAIRGANKHFCYSATMHCCGLSAHECPSRSKLPPQCRTQTQCSARAAHLWPARCFALPRGARLFNESQRLTINLYIIFEMTVAATNMSLPAPASSESRERARERSVKRSRQGPWALAARMASTCGAGRRACSGCCMRRLRGQRAERAAYM